LKLGADHRAMALMLLFVLLWTSVELIAATLLGRYTAYQVVWTRYAVHLVLLAALWGWRDPMSLVRTPRPLFQIARSLLMLVMPVAWFLGTQRGVSVSATMLVFWLAPLAMLFIAWAWLRERVPARAWVAATLGLAGAALFFLPAAWPRNPWLLAAPLAMALTFALYVPMTRRLRGERLRANLFYTAIGVFVPLTPLMPLVWVVPGAGDLARLVAVGVLGTLTLLVLDRAVSAAPVGTSAPLVHTQLALTLALALALGHEALDARTVAALALCAAPLVLLAMARAPTAAPARPLEAAS